MIGQIKKTQPVSDIQLEKLELENKKESALKKITDLFYKFKKYKITRYYQKYRLYK